MFPFVVRADGWAGPPTAAVLARALASCGHSASVAGDSVRQGGKGKEGEAPRGVLRPLAGFSGTPEGRGLWPGREALTGPRAVASPFHLPARVASFGLVPSHQ